MCECASPQTNKRKRPCCASSSFLHWSPLMASSNIHWDHPDKGARDIWKRTNKRVRFRCAAAGHTFYRRGISLKPTRPIECPACNTLAAKYPTIASQWHPTRNGDLTAEDVSWGSHKRIWWRCSNTCSPSCSHEWATAINNRTTGGTGCPHCTTSGFKRILPCCKAKSLLGDEQLMRDWDTTRNTGIDPRALHQGSDVKVWWKCSTCSGKWRTPVEWRTGKKAHGCIYCTHQSKIPFCIEDSVAGHKNLTRLWHPTKNLPTLAREVYAGSTSRKYWWLCSQACASAACCHEWESEAANVRQVVCPFCTGRVVCCPRKSLIHDERFELASWAEPRLDPVNFSAGSQKRITWRCVKNTTHPTWRTTISNRVRRGTSCPLCSSSKYEQRAFQILSLMIENEEKTSTTLLRLKHQFRIPGGTRYWRNDQRVDFMVLSSDHKPLVAVEIHGIQHYIPVSFGSSTTTPEEMLLSNQTRDNRKKAHLDQVGIPLVVLKYSDDDTVWQRAVKPYLGKKK